MSSSADSRSAATRPSGAALTALHPPGTHTQSLANPAIGVLELARAQQQHAWLYLDPAGPTCALSAAEIDFALRSPHHPELKEALARFAAGAIDRAVRRPCCVPTARCCWPLSKPPGAPAGIRTVSHPDGSSSLFAFTSAPEVLAFSPAGAVAALTTEQVLDTARRGHSNIVINPAGPSIQLSLNEIAA